MEIQCPNCKYDGAGKYINKGSFGVEVILWLLFLLPGLVYTVWRLSNRILICPKCNFENVVRVGKSNTSLNTENLLASKKRFILPNWIIIAFFVVMVLFYLGGRGGGNSPDPAAVPAPVIEAALREYDIGNTVTLESQFASTFVMYTDIRHNREKAVFDNGLKATVMDYDITRDNQVIYQVQVFEDGGVEYIGWIRDETIKR